jgi:4-amino-4-deoxy-L-arabinose transferase-like glycosyltransferase
VAAAVLTGMSLLTRYVGLAFIITGTIGLLFFSRLPWKKRVLPVMIYGLISFLPIIGWWLWINLRSPGSNAIQAGKNIWEQLTQFRLSVTEIIWSWLPYTSLLPDYSYNLARNLLVFFILLMVILFFLAARKLHKTDQHLFTDSNGLSYAV